MLWWAILVLVVGGAVPAAFHTIRWALWLRFASKIVENHGVEGLRAVPPIARAFGDRNRLGGKTQDERHGEGRKMIYGRR